MKCACGKPLSGTCCSEQLTGRFHLHTPEHEAAIRVTMGLRSHEVIFLSCSQWTLVVPWRGLLVVCSDEKYNKESTHLSPLDAFSELQLDATNWAPGYWPRTNTRRLSSEVLTCSLFTTQSRRITAKHKDTDFPQVEQQVHLRIGALLYDLQCGMRGGL